MSENAQIRIDMNNFGHACKSRRDGDWMVFTCPIKGCEQYERRINWKTGEIVVEGVNPNIEHSGVSKLSQNDPALAVVHAAGGDFFDKGRQLSGKKVVPKLGTEGEQN